MDTNCSDLQIAQFGRPQAVAVTNQDHGCATTLSVQDPGGAFNPGSGGGFGGSLGSSSGTFSPGTFGAGGGFNPGRAVNPGGAVNPGDAVNPPGIPR